MYVKLVTARKLWYICVVHLEKIEAMKIIKYNAFISYNHKDKKIAKKLQRKLERFPFSERLKDEMVKGDGYRFRIFRYETDLVAQNLDDGLREELDRSEYLIVVCSPNSAKSYWVGREIDHFINTGRAKKIIPVIISGTAYSCGEDECYHPKLKEEFPKSLLGQDVRDAGDDFRFMGFSKTVAKIASMLSGVPDAFDSIWNRYRRMHVMMMIAILLLGVLMSAIVFFAWNYNREFDVSVALKEVFQNSNLPDMKNISITLNAANMEPRSQTVVRGGDAIVFRDIPGRMKGKSATLNVSGIHIMQLSTDVKLRKSISVEVNRDTLEYGDVNISIIDDKFTILKKALVEIDGIQCRTDNEGYVKLRIPYSQQCSTYTVKYDDKIGKIKMPCTSTSAVMIE